MAIKPFKMMTTQMACCGCQTVSGFPQDWYYLTKREIERKKKAIDKHLTLDVSRSKKPFMLAILNENQHQYIHDILKKHDFKVLRTRRNGRHGHKLYLYARLGPW